MTSGEQLFFHNKRPASFSNECDEKGRFFKICGEIIVNFWGLRLLVVIFFHRIQR